MNLKLEVAKACIFMLIGAFLCKTLLPSPKPQEAAKVQQEQKQDCKVIVKKIVKPDGTVSEETSVVASSSQKQEVVAEKPKDKKHSAILLKDQLSYSYKYIDTKIVALSPILQYRKDNSFHLGVKIDF